MSGWSSVCTSVVSVRVRGGLGTGFVVAPNGLVATNHHVVGYDGAVVLRTHDRRDVPGRVVFVDARSDLALVAPEQALGARPLPIGESRNAPQGLEVVAIGHPHGLDYTLTRGIVSACRRVHDVDHLQIDAAIHPGNSGGPLLSSEGRVLGVNTWGVGGADSLGFAVAIHELEPALVELGRLAPADAVRCAPRYRCHACEADLDLGRERCRSCGARLRFHEWDDLGGPDEIVAERAASAILEELGFHPPVCRTGPGSWLLPTGAGELIVRLIGPPFHVVLAVDVVRAPAKPDAPFLRFLATANDRTLGAARLALRDDVVSLALFEPVSMLDVRTVRAAVEDMLRLSHEMRRVLVDAFGARPPRDT